MAAEPELAALRKDTIDFYTDRGFSLYDGAYSRHSNTANSVPYILSFGNAPLATSDTRVQHIRPPKLDYFGLLNDRGYAISSLHVDFIDYCAAGQVEMCETFRRSDLSSAAHFDLSTVERAKLIGFTLTSLSRVTATAYEQWRNLSEFLWGSAPNRLRYQTKLFPLASVKAFDRFEAKLGQVRNGHVYLAHFLLPHDPYELDADCRVKPRDQWQHQWNSGPIALRQRAYADQAHCAMQQIDRLLAALDRTTAGRNAIVVIHGDHGSRISNRLPDMAREDTGVLDYAMAHSTMFAIRAPGIAPGLVEGRAPIEQMLGDFSRSNFTQAPKTGEGQGEIFLTDKLQIPKKRVKLPLYGTALTDN
jgi:hypothetical protein